MRINTVPLYERRIVDCTRFPPTTLLPFYQSSPYLSFLEDSHHANAVTPIPITAPKAIKPPVPIFTPS